MYHLAQSSRGVYPVQLTDEDKTDLQGQDCLRIIF